MTKKIALFEGRKIRREWDEKEEKWYFSIVDVVAVLTDQADFQTARKYWNKLKERLGKEGSQSVTNCHRLKMLAGDGKLYFTDVADTEVMLRIIQSVPSPKAEPFKLWLARAGYERLEEQYDPELAINRALNSYLKKGYSENWINQRLKSIEIRKALTDEWEKRGVKKGDEFAILTDDITLAWAGMHVREYKNLKGLKKESLRDNMTNLELVLNMLAETATAELSAKHAPKSFDENRKVAREGGGVAGSARKDMEKKLGKRVVNSRRFENLARGKRLKK
ncbi:MAG: BRO family protein [Candidatus Moraniibacteriota bacterium]